MLVWGPASEEGLWLELCFLEDGRCHQSCGKSEEGRGPAVWDLGHFGVEPSCPPVTRTLEPPPSIREALNDPGTNRLSASLVLVPACARGGVCSPPQGLGDPYTCTACHRGLQNLSVQWGVRLMDGQQYQ